jgi:hypothetical protein
MGDYETIKEASDVLRQLKPFLDDPDTVTIGRSLELLLAPQQGKQQQQQQQQQQHQVQQQHPGQRLDDRELQEREREREREQERERKRLQEWERDQVARVPQFVEAIADSAAKKISRKEKAVTFQEPAFRCLSDYQKCLETSTNTRLCVAALIISMGRLLIPFVKSV